MNSKLKNEFEIECEDSDEQWWMKAIIVLQKDDFGFDANEIIRFFGNLHFVTLPGLHWFGAEYSPIRVSNKCTSSS